MHPVQHGRDVLAVHPQVIQVSEEQGGIGAFGRKAVQHADDIGGRPQRVLRDPAEWLQEHDRTGRPGRPGRGGQVLHRQLVLGGGRGSLNPVAVQQVEPAAAKPGSQARHDVQVVQEFLLAARPGDDAPVTGPHVPGEAVQRDELHASITHRSLKSVHLGVPWDS